MSGPVLVVGANGNVGRALVASLAAAGVTVHAAVTRPDAYPTSRLVRPVALNLLDPSTFGAAVADAAGLFLIRPPAISRVGPTLNALADAAAAAGVRHIVFSSVTGADTNRVVPHHRVETHLQGMDVPWTILRPGFFSQNLTDAYRDDIVRDDRIVLPAGSGRAAFIDARDIGEVAARVFLDPTAHAHRGYALTGPQALSFEQVAAILSGELGRTIRYEPTSALRYAWHVRRQGRPWMQAIVQTVLHTGLRRGDAEGVDPTLPDLLGRPARTLTEYVHDHRATWAP